MKKIREKTTRRFLALLAAACMLGTMPEVAVISFAEENAEEFSEGYGIDTDGQEQNREDSELQGQADSPAQDEEKTEALFEISAHCCSIMKKAPIRAIGINLHVKGTDKREDSQADILSGNEIYIGIISLMPEFYENPQVWEAVKGLIRMFPDKEVIDY